VNRRVYRLHHALHTFGDVVVPEPKHAVAFSFQPSRPHIIMGFVLGFCVLRAVDFDQQSGRHAAEVGNVRPDRDLAPEVRTLDI
jgi:hypothetical protein